jgi:hypothetical protein
MSPAMITAPPPSRPAAIGAEKRAFDSTTAASLTGAAETELAATLALALVSDPADFEPHVQPDAPTSMARTRTRMHA